jgi:hypothetical protein
VNTRRPTGSPSGRRPQRQHGSARPDDRQRQVGPGSRGQRDPQDLRARRPVSRPDRSQQDIGTGDAKRWLPAIAAGCVLLVVVAAGASGRSEGDSGDAVPTTVASAVPLPLPVDTTMTTVPTIGTDTTTAPIQKTQFAQPLVRGAAGEEVRQLQTRLTELGFVPGEIDGQFGSLTQQAVWAYKKLIGGMTWQELDNSNNATTVTNELWQQMQEPITIAPRRPQGLGTTHVEVYLPIQVMAVFADDRPIFIAHISTGELLDDGVTPETFCETVMMDTDANGNPLDPPVEKAICAEAKTPGGMFQFTRRYEGKRLGPLGGMLNPVYFNYGIAVHGAENVPTYPASHGCVRIANALSGTFQEIIDNRDRIFVWGHDGKEPEWYTRQESLPSFNRPDPNATTTTSSTTTTTVAPTTTVKATTTTTTKPPATTTTVKATTTTVAPTTTTAPTTTAAAEPAPAP